MSSELVKPNGPLDMNWAFYRPEALLSGPGCKAGDRHAVRIQTLCSIPVSLSPDDDYHHILSLQHLTGAVHTAVLLSADTFFSQNLLFIAIYAMFGRPSGLCTGCQRLSQVDREVRPLPFSFRG